MNTKKKGGGVFNFFVHFLSVCSPAACTLVKIVFTRSVICVTLFGNADIWLRHSESAICFRNYPVATDKKTGGSLNECHPEIILDRRRVPINSLTTCTCHVTLPIVCASFEIGCRFKVRLCVLCSICTKLLHKQGGGGGGDYFQILE